jgi:hypothetical protein
MTTGHHQRLFSSGCVDPGADWASFVKLVACFELHEGLKFNAVLIKNADGAGKKACSFSVAFPLDNCCWVKKL